ncbi:MAG: gliding motility-associated C-terminal domain-containing protein [Bacteroidales bacterium]|nr:gliding motility-associated C-terminal domain-containing protein [Bacteroidales bacterium]
MKKTFLTLLILLTAILPAIPASAQQVLIENDTLYISPCMSGVSTGRIIPYQTFPYRSYDGWVVIETVPGDTLVLNGSYGIWDGNLQIWDGTPSTGIMLTDYNWVGEGSLQLIATSGRFTFHFHTDTGDDERFDLTWTSLHPELCCTERPYNLTYTTVAGFGGTWSATLNWQTTAAPGTQYRISVDGTPCDTVSTLTATVTGLIASSQHTLEVGIVGSESCGYAMARTTMRTPCTGSTNMPLQENFDDIASDTVPPCWLYAMNYDDTSTRPMVVAGYFNSHPRSLRMGCGSNSVASHFSIVTTPHIAEGGTWLVTLRLMASHPNTRIQIGTADTAVASLSLSGFAHATTIDVTNNIGWITSTVRINGVAAGKRLAMVMQQGDQDGIQRLCYIDDIRVENCGADSLQAYRIMSDSLTLRWVTFGNPTCNLGIRHAGAMADDTLLLGVTSPLTIGGLTPSTRYTFTIYPTCGTRQGLPLSISARTSAPVNNAICASMEGSYAEGWTQILHTNSENGGSSINYIHGDNYLVSPQTALAGKTVSLECATVYSWIWMQVGTMSVPDDESTFTLLDSFFFYDEYRYHPFTLQIPNTCTDQYLAFRLKNTPDYYCYYIHNLHIGDMPSFTSHISHVRGTSVELRWTDPDNTLCDTFVVEYGQRDFTLGSGQRDTIYSSTRATITGLTPVTDYDFIVWRYCDNDPCDFRTRTMTRYDNPIPYCTDFEGTDYNWDLWSGDWWVTESNNNTPRIIDHPWMSGAGHSFDMGSFGLSWGYRNTVALPDVKIDTGMMLSFYASSTVPQSRMVLGTWNPDYDMGFCAFDTLEITSAERQHYVYRIPDSITDAEGRLTLQWFHTAEYEFHHLYIDELQLSHAWYGNIATAYVGFDSVAFSCSDSVRVRLDNGMSATSPNLTFEGLDSGTLYHIYVTPLNDTGTCESYAGYVVTHASGYGAGYSGCFTFDELLSYELPTGWHFAGSAQMAADDALEFSGMATLPPLGDLSGLRLTLDNVGTVPIAVGYTTDSVGFTSIDTIPTGCTAIILPAMPAGAQVALKATGTARLKMAGLSGCGIVDFVGASGTVVCNTRNGSMQYYLTVTDTATGDERTIHIVDSIYVVNNLTLGHTYRLSYRCEGESDACAPWTLVTLSDSINLPYCEKFDPEGNTGVPTNWTFIYDEDIVPALDLGWGETPLRLGEWWRPNQYAILPPITGSGDISMRFHVHSWDPGTFQVGTVDANADTSTFIPLYTNGYYETGWIEKTIVIDSLGNRRIAFRTHSVNLLDYVNISTNPAVKFSLVGWRTMRLTANVPDTIVDYYVRYRRDDGRDSVLHITRNPYDFVEPEYNDIYLTVATDSTGYICSYENPRWQMSALHTLPECPLDEYWHWEYRGLGDTWDDYYRGRRPHKMRINSDPNNYAIRLLPDYDVDSVQQLSLAFDLAADRVGEMIEVGVMWDAYDTGSFTPVDTFYYTAPYSRWQTCRTSFANYNGNGRWIAFRHRSGQCTDCEGEMAVGRYMVTDCPAATATATLSRWNKVEINASDGGFYVEFHPTDMPWLSNKMYVASVPMMLTLLGETTYEFRFGCDTLSFGCDPQTVHTGVVPIDIPTCLTFDDADDTLLHGWTLYGSNTHVEDSVLHIDGLTSTPDINIASLCNVGLSLWYKASRPNDRLRVGTMVTPEDPQTFWSAATLGTQDTGVWQRFVVDLSASPVNAHFLAFNGNGMVDNIRIDTVSANAFTVLQADFDAITLGWSSVGNPDITITMMQGDSVLNVYNNPTSPLTVGGLTTLSPYTFYFVSMADDTGSCSMHYEDSVKLVTPRIGTGCVNTTDLYSPSTLFSSGTYGNPYATEGPVDFGYSHPDSRHTVCYDTSARDPRTGGLLRMVPEGATSSVRLGNPNTDMQAPQAEAVTYSLMVDTADFELLLLRYAAVLQDPMHATEDQPRVRIEVLDSNHTPINPLCTSADFIADASLGWNTAANSVLWKDWTSVGIDLTMYAGQQVYVRLTTYDCNEGSHYGYAYFTLECMRKSMETTACGDIDSNTFTAPAGFNYRWYTNQSSATISTAQSITRATANVTYFCDLSKIDNAACMFTINAYGGTRYPMASMDTTMTISDCQFHVNFINTSGVSSDGVNLIPGEGCETAFWNFGNGLTSTSYHASTTYTMPGVYTVMLVSGIAGDECQDTTLWTLNIDFPTYPSISGPDSLCYNALDTIRIHNAAPDVVGSWIADGNDWILPLSPANYVLGSNSYSLSITDPYGCTQYADIPLYVNNGFNQYDTLTVCTMMLPFSYADTVFGVGSTGGEYHFYLNSASGCDSNYHLWLTVSDTDGSIALDTVRATICSNQSFTFFGSDYNTEGSHNNVHLDANGFCDSIHTLLLNVNPTSGSDTVATACDTYLWHGHSYANLAYSAFDTIDSTILAAANQYACDSTLTLHLTLYSHHDTTIVDEVLENAMPYMVAGTMVTPSDLAATTAQYSSYSNIFTIPTAEGCDSNINLSLTVWLNRTITLTDTICRNQLPLFWNGFLISTDSSAATSTYYTTTTHGADSTTTLMLTILENPTSTYFDTVVENQLPHTFRGYSFNATTDTALTLPSSIGCDTIAAYHLLVWPNQVVRLERDICDDTLPYLWDGNTFTGTDSVSFTINDIHGADSTVTLVVYVHPTYELADTHVFCPSQPFVYEGIDYGGPTVFDAPHLSIHGCDSLVHVALVPRDSNYHLCPLYRMDSATWHPADTIILGCAPDTLFLRDTTPGAVAWLWTLTAGTDTVISTTNEASIELATPRVPASYQVIITSDAGCNDTLQYPVYMFGTPDAEFEWNPPVPAIDNPEVQFANLSSPKDSLDYFWRIPRQAGSADCDTTSEAEPLYHWGSEGDNMEGEYDVSLTAFWHQIWLLAGGDTVSHTCVDSTTHTIYITNDFLQFPNLVTPNGDGTNDTWRVVNLIEYGNYPTNELWIYNQWGAEIYHVRNIRQEKDFWDPNATSSPDGTYYFRFSGRGIYGVVKRNGAIEVLRK